MSMRLYWMTAVVEAVKLGVPATEGPAVDLFCSMRAGSPSALRAWTSAFNSGVCASTAVVLLKIAGAVRGDDVVESTQFA